MDKFFLRPFLPAAILCVISALAIILNNALLLAVAVFAIVFLLAFAFLFKRRTSVFMPAIVAVMCGIAVLISGAFQYARSVNSINDILGKQISFKGCITDADNENVYTVRSSSGDFSHGKYVVFLNGAEHSVGDIVSVRGVLREHDDKYRLYNLSNGILAQIQIDEIAVIGHKDSAATFFSALSDYISSVINNYLPANEAAFTEALTVGSKSSLTQIQNDSIRGAGVSHLVVVSGLHLGVVCGAVIMFTRKLKVSRYITVLCAIGAAVLIIGLCGFGISAIRSGIIYFIMLLGLLIFRKSDPLNSLCLTVCIMLIASPFLLGNISFLLSVAATFGLVVLSPIMIDIVNLDNLKCSKIVHKLIIFTRDNICISIATALTTLPILIAFFGSISLSSVLANLLLTYPVSVVLVLALLGVLFSGFGFISQCIFFVQRYICTYSLFVIELLGANGRFTLSLDNRLWFAALLLVIYICFLIYNFYTKLSDRRKRSENNE